MNEFTALNMIKTTHLKANMSRFQISPYCGLIAFHVLIVCLDGGESYTRATKTRKTKRGEFDDAKLAMEGQKPSLEWLIRSCTWHSRFCDCCT